MTYNVFGGTLNLAQLQRLRPIYLILKSFAKYTIDRDTADNADKNRKNGKKAHRADVTHCSRDTYTKDNVIYIITCKPSRKL